MSGKPSQIAVVLDSTGATMVEFALGLIVVLALLGGLFDFGVGFHRYNLLTYVASTVTRQFSTQVAELTGNTCTTVEESIRSEAVGIFNQRMGINSQSATSGAVLDRNTLNGDFQVAAELLAPPPPVTGQQPTPYKLKVTAQYRLRCFFCIFLPKQTGFILSTKSETLIEDNNFQCT